MTALDPQLDPQDEVAAQTIGRLLVHTMLEEETRAQQRKKLLKQFSAPADLNCKALYADWCDAYPPREPVPPERAEANEAAIEARILEIAKTRWEELQAEAEQERPGVLDRGPHCFQ